jgi:RimJ/RimL family protein N-acetyltransferase
VDRLAPPPVPHARRLRPRFPRASRLIAIIHPDNRPSQRVAEKIGLRLEKRSLVHGGREAVIYAGSV